MNKDANTQRSDSLTCEPNPVIRRDLAEILDAEINWRQLNEKAVLVSGAGGFLGSYLVKTLLAASARYDLATRVIASVRPLGCPPVRLSGWVGHRGLTIVEQDFAKALESDFPAADIIVHAASQASPRFYGIDPVGTLLPNVYGTANLLRHAQAHGSTQFLFVSSGSVYGDPDQDEGEISEVDVGRVDPMDIRSCYAESKRMGENMCVSWAHQYGINASVVRPFHTYGPSVALDDGRVFADFVADVVADRPITIKSDGKARRAFCYVTDAISGMMTVLLRGHSGHAYNVGNPSAEISVRDLARLLAKIAPRQNVGIQEGKHPGGSAYMRSSTLRASPAVHKLEALGWSAKIGLEEGFRRTIESYR